MGDKNKIKSLLRLIEELNYRQWQMIKTITDIAFEEKTKDVKIKFEKVDDLICDDLIENGLKKE